jgi:exopolyphosphatase/pppGpp-phosphohydrolase
MDFPHRSKLRKDTIILKRSARFDAALQFHQDFPEIPLTEVAYIHNCDRSSINKRLRGTTKSHTIAAQNRQVLSPAEEQVLVKWAIQYHQWGLPLRVYHLDQFAFKILLRKAQSGVSSPYIGTNWHLSFLQRHPEIKRKLSQPIDRNRVTACTPANLTTFYQLYIQITKSIASSLEIYITWMRKAL